ncbi:hypothetical protein HK405_005106 [Cladochytrium tenue]|nr:hypothetical protein HK405_005106 [Cladochytrium tenue]
MLEHLAAATADALIADVVPPGLLHLLPPTPLISSVPPQPSSAPCAPPSCRRRHDRCAPSTRPSSPPSETMLPPTPSTNAPAPTILPDGFTVRYICENTGGLTPTLRSTTHSAPSTNAALHQPSAQSPTLKTPPFPGSLPLPTVSKWSPRADKTFTKSRAATSCSASLSTLPTVLSGSLPVAHNARRLFPSLCDRDDIPSCLLPNQRSDPSHLDPNSTIVYDPALTARPPPPLPTFPSRKSLLRPLHAVLDNGFLNATAACTAWAAVRDPASPQDFGPRCTPPPVSVPLLLHTTSPPRLDYADIPAAHVEGLLDWAALVAGIPATEFDGLNQNGFSDLAFVNMALSELELFDFENTCPHSLQSAVPSHRQDHLLIYEDTAFKIVDAPSTSALATIGFRHLLRTRSLNVPFAMSASAVLVTVHSAATLNHLEMLWFAKPASVSSRSHLQSLVVMLASTARRPAFPWRAAVLGLVGGALLLALPNLTPQRFASISRADILDVTARLQHALNLTHMDPPHPDVEVDSKPSWYTRASLGAGEVVEKGYIYDAGLAATDVPGRLYGEPFFATPRWRVRTILLDAAPKAGETGKTESEARTADRLRQRAEHVDARWDRHGRLQSFVHAVADDVAGAWVEEEDAVAIAIAFLTAAQTDFFAGGDATAALTAAAAAAEAAGTDGPPVGGVFSSGLGLSRDDAVVRKTLSLDLQSRRDWVVTVADGRYAGLLPLDAEVHHHIRVSNNTVAEWSSGLRLSDAYQHEAAAGRVVPQLLGTVAIALTTVGALVALGTFLMQTASQRFHWRAFWTVFGLDLAAGVLSEVNGRSQFLINASPTAPLTDQVLRKVVGAATTSVGTALVAGSCVAVTSPPFAFVRRTPWSSSSSSSSPPSLLSRLATVLLAATFLSGLTLLATVIHFTFLIPTYVESVPPIYTMLANEDSAAVTAVVFVLRSVPSTAVVGCVFQLITHWTLGWRPRHLLAAAATAALSSLTDIAATEDGRRVVSTHLHAVFVVVVKDVVLYLCYGFVFRHVIGDLRGSVATLQAMGVVSALMLWWGWSGETQLKVVSPAALLALVAFEVASPVLILALYPVDLAEVDDAKKDQ